MNEQQRKRLRELGEYATKGGAFDANELLYLQTLNQVRIADALEGLVTIALEVRSRVAREEPRAHETPESRSVLVPIK